MLLPAPGNVLDHEARQRPALAHPRPVAQEESGPDRRLGDLPPLGLLRGQVDQVALAPVDDGLELEVRQPSLRQDGSGHGQVVGHIGREDGAEGRVFDDGICEASSQPSQFESQFARRVHRILLAKNTNKCRTRTWMILPVFELAGPVARVRDLLGVLDVVPLLSFLFGRLGVLLNLSTKQRRIIFHQRMTALCPALLSQEHKLVDPLLQSCDKTCKRMKAQGRRTFPTLRFSAFALCRCSLLHLFLCRLASVKPSKRSGQWGQP